MKSLNTFGAALAVAVAPVVVQAIPLDPPRFPVLPLHPTTIMSVQSDYAAITPRSLPHVSYAVDEVVTTTVTVDITKTIHTDHAAITPRGLPHALHAADKGATATVTVDVTKTAPEETTVPTENFAGPNACGQGPDLTPCLAARLEPIVTVAVPEHAADTSANGDTIELHHLRKPSVLNMVHEAQIPVEATDSSDKDAKLEHRDLTSIAPNNENPDKGVLDTLEFENHFQHISTPQGGPLANWQGPLPILALLDEPNTLVARDDSDASKPTESVSQHESEEATDKVSSAEFDDKAFQLIVYQLKHNNATVDNSTSSTLNATTPDVHSASHAMASMGAKIGRVLHTFARPIRKLFRLATKTAHEAQEIAPKPAASGSSQPTLISTTEPAPTSTHFSWGRDGW